MSRPHRLTCMSFSAVIDTPTWLASRHRRGRVQRNQAFPRGMSFVVGNSTPHFAARDVGAFLFAGMSLNGVSTDLQTTVEGRCRSEPRHHAPWEANPNGGEGVPSGCGCG
jgi:hypothetical protein